MKKLITLFIVLFCLSSYSQMNVNVNLDEGELPEGWLQSGFYLTGFYHFPCQVQSAYANLYLWDFGWWGDEDWYGNTSAYILSNNETNTHGPIHIGFDLRISDYYDDPIPLTDFDYGGMYIEYSLNNGAVWAIHSTINSQSFIQNASGCTRYTTTIPQPALAQGTHVKLRFRIQTPPSGPDEYDLLFYFDNLSVVQEQTNHCQNPTQVSVSDISSTSAKFTWLAPVAGDPVTSYTYELRTAGTPNSGAVGLTAAGTTTELEKIFNNLEPNKNYYFYITSVCPSNSAVDWVAVGVFRTPCAVLPDVVAEDQTFCGPTRVSDLAAELHDSAHLLWYTSATEPLPLNATDYLTTGTYYGSLTLNGCYSKQRTPIAVTIHQKPPAPQIADQTFCGSATAADLAVSSELALHWYDASQLEIEANTPLRSGTYYLSQSDDLCESAWSPFQVTVNPIPNALVLENLLLCGRTTISEISLPGTPGANYSWYTDSTSITALSPMFVLTDGSYYVSQILAGCESPRSVVHVTAYEAIPIPTTANQNFCTTSARVSDLQISGMPGATIRWYNRLDATTPLNPNTVLTTNYYYADQKWGDCQSPKVRITVNVVGPIGALQITDQHFCESATVSDLRVNTAEGMQAKWYRSAQGGYALSGDIPLQNGTYYATQGKYGCESIRVAFNVVIEPKPAAPTGPSSQSVVEGSLISDLIVSAFNPVWYGSLSDIKYDRNRLSPEFRLFDQEVYYVVNRSETGCPSDPLIIIVTLTLGVDDFDLKALTYYPNPTSDRIHITYKEVIESYIVYDSNGRKVAHQHNQDTQASVDLSSFATGVYLIQIRTATSTQTIKVLRK
ncbi:T9SS type A sorting domain-containing protein [Flavobacterium sp. JP2137]|uniref:fibronectin type III domain-containing protein n=1 Tax=Flavobacterium sp. JP2137 TaxID=3414510 RepID=UPI003D2FB28F